MGILLAFFVGWAAGAKAGHKGFAEVVDAAKTVRDSEEFASLVSIARSHLSASLSELGKLTSGEASMPDTRDLLARVQRMTSQRPGF